MRPATSWSLSSAVEMDSERSATQGRASSFLEKGKVCIGQELLTMANSTATLPSLLLAYICCEEVQILCTLQAWGLSAAAYQATFSQAVALAMDKSSQKPLKHRFQPS